MSDNLLTVLVVEPAKPPYVIIIASCRGHYDD